MWGRIVKKHNAFSLPEIQKKKVKMKQGYTSRGNSNPFHPK